MNPLEPVWRWYQVARDSMRLALRVIEKKIPGALTKKYSFHALSGAAAGQRFRESQQELNNMANVAMVAVFERTLRDFVAGPVLPRLPDSDDFAKAIQVQIQNDIEFWHVSARLIDEVMRTRVA